MVEALEQQRPLGKVLELACGTGWWTQYLALNAQEVTAVDAADEMLAFSRERVKRQNVAYVRADIFSWRPEQPYDFVFFAFWLSHVPHDRFGAFWRLVRDSLARNGRVFFIDELENAQARKFEQRIGADAVLRTLEDGRQFRAVKVFYEPGDLHVRLRHLGWELDVQAAGPNFYWGCGSPAVR